MTTQDLQFFISDIETLKEYTLIGGRNYRTKEVVIFRINRWHNDLYAMAKWFESNRHLWMVGFNYYGFDAQVVEWILRNYESWHDRTNLEICAMIAQKGSDVIDDGKYDIAPRIRLEWLSFNIIDLFKVHHLDNKQNRASLKWLEIMMDIPNVAEMPIHHSRDNLTEVECEMIDKYWINDLDATEQLLRITLGDTELGLYKGKNMLEERLMSAARYNFDISNALNWSDTKLGEQVNMHYFCKLKNVKVEDVYEMKRNRKRTRPFTFGKCIPDHVTFQTKPFQEFHKKMRGIRVNLVREKQEFTFHYNGTTYTIAQGGIHSVDSKRIVVCPPGYRIVDIDLGSQYPGTLVRRLLYPSHLGPEWLQNILERMTERIQTKGASKQEGITAAEKATLEGKAETLKKCLNAGGYGMTGQSDSWQYDPFVMYSCTIGNEFEMLMLVESFELKGIHCISANTDGLTVLFPEHLGDIFQEICDEWEKKIKLPVVAGEMQGRLEFTEYEKLVQEHVNCYIATKKGGKLKVKGRFNYDSPINKNNTKDITRIQRMAIQNYYSLGVPVEETVRGCTDIFKFIFGYKSRDFTFLATDAKGNTTDLGHLLRCYASTEGVRIRKSKEEEAPTVRSRGNMKIIKESLVTPYNTHEAKPFDQYHVNYDYYIQKTMEVISGILPVGFTASRAKKPPPPIPKEQGSLF